MLPLSVKSPSSFSSETIFDSALHLKMSFLQKYVGSLLVEFILISAVCTLTMLSPLARFHITENDWLLFLLCFLFCTSYLGLVHFIQLPVIKVTLILYIIIEALTISVMVTYNDLLFLYQAVLLSTCCLLGLFLYTLQSKWDLNIWVILLMTFGCAYLFSTSVRALFGGTKEENILSIAVSFVILFYHSFVAYMIMTKLTVNDYLFAFINAHTLPVNMIVHSSLVYKPPK